MKFVIRAYHLETGAYLGKMEFNSREDALSFVQGARLVTYREPQKAGWDDHLITQQLPFGKVFVSFGVES